MRFIFLSLLLCGSLQAKEYSAEERKEIFEGATRRLKETGIEKRAPKVGEAFPDLKIAEKNVSEWVKDGPLVITFYRGGWCPYCMKQLKQLSQELPQFKGARIIAISPESEKQVAISKRKNDLKIPLISDKNNETARLLGIAFKVEDAMIDMYKGYGIDLKVSQGNGDNILPVPATFVIGKDMKVAYSYVEVDYTQRAALSDIVTVVQRLMTP
ncbi:MAG: AhpC/TSA family protein [Bacteriovoracaceae bacterium]|nr:AhpC/TSA family protein [Bacteriovoracaceae bacterium]